MCKTTLRDVYRMIDGAKRVFWFIDFDGTLVSIVSRPESVVLTTETKALLDRLAACRGMKAAVVSGRPLADIRRRIGLRRLTYAGNHGLEIKGAAVSFLHPGAEAARSSLAEVLASWGELPSRYPGALLEDKGLTLTFHYRQVASSSQNAARREAVGSITRLCRAKKIRMTAGKKVIEARPPVKWGKGDALRHLLREWNYREDTDLAIAIGDDETDRDAFAALRKKGVALYVGRGKMPPEAMARLRGQYAVRELLRRAVEVRS